MFALHQEIRRIRAERLLDAGQAALYPHLKKDPAQWWWDRLVQQAQGTIRQTNANVREVKNWLRSILGGGFSE